MIRLGLAGPGNILATPRSLFSALCVNTQIGADTTVVYSPPPGGFPSPLLNRLDLDAPGRSSLALRAQPEPTSAWRTIQSDLRRLVGESTYEIWLATVELKSWDGELLLLMAPPATRAWVADRFGRLLERCAREVLGPSTRVSFETADIRRKQAPIEIQVPPSGSFNPRYSFEQFIIGHGNRLAHAAALAVAEYPGQAYNPLFLHAPPGLGKTHLLHAIGNYILAYGAGATVRYTTAESFTNHFLAALNAKSLQPFKQAYRDADVLLIDDVQFLASKTRTEEEFFHTFDALYQAGRQLVLTCDRLPSSLVAIEERLRERFEAGLVADISAPDHATRVAILRKRATLDGVMVDDPAVLNLIADRVTSNIRALEGALIRVVAYHSLTREPLNLDLATEVMDSMYPRRGRSKPSITAVQAAVAAHFSLSTAELISPKRKANVVWPRQVAIHFARQLTGAPLEKIGEAFGGRNHNTVLHACRKVSDRLAGDQQLAGELDVLLEEIRRLSADRDY
jgi:chromosomal replication initiator protein